MKKILLSLGLIIALVVGWILISPLFLDKVVEENLPAVDSQNSSEKIQKKIANFVDADSVHKGSGDLVYIEEGNKKYLRFENFSVTNGPDLFVSLNKGGSAESEHVLISKLKGNIGSQNYDISEYDISDFKSVSIYCRAFSEEFATAVFDIESESTSLHQDQLDQMKDVLDKEKEIIALTSVDDRGGMGVAERSFGENFTHNLVLEVSDPKPGFFYEGWLVKKPSLPIKFYSTGALEKNSNGMFTLEYSADINERSQYNKVVVTEETLADGLDGKPEDHIFDGVFK